MGKHGAETGVTHRLTHASLQATEGAPGGRVTSLRFRGHPRAPHLPVPVQVLMQFPSFVLEMHGWPD